MLNIDLLELDYPSYSRRHIDEWLHVTPKIWAGLALAAGAVTSVAVALTTTLPALSLGFTFAAVFGGVATFFCTTKMLVAIGVQKIRNFLLEPAPTDFQTASTKTLNIATTCVAVTQVIAAFCCGLGCLILASLCLSLLLILPIELYAAEILGVLTFGAILAWTTCYFCMNAGMATDIECSYKQVIRSKMAAKQRKLYEQLLTPGFSQLSEMGRRVCRQILNGTQSIDDLNAKSIDRLFSHNEGLTQKDFSIILDLCADLVKEISIDSQCEGDFGNLVELDAAKYPNLRGLHLEGAIKIKCVKNLDKCKNLRWLSVCNCPSIQGAQPGKSAASANDANVKKMLFNLNGRQTLHTSDKAPFNSGPIVVCTSTTRTSIDSLEAIGVRAD